MQIARSTTLAVVVVAVAIVGQTAPAAGAASSAGVASRSAAWSAVTASPAFRGHEVFKIVSLEPAAKRPKMTAKGAFTAHGYFNRRLRTAVFPAGRITIFHHSLRTSYYGPDLRTCRFKIWQRGTFRVVRATRRYAGLHGNGDYWTTITARLGRVGPGECSSKIVSYRSVTYEIGYVY